MITPATIGILAHRKTSGWVNAYSVVYDGVNEAAINTNMAYSYYTATGGKTWSMWVKANAVPASSTNDYTGIMRNITTTGGSPTGIWNLGIRTRSSGTGLTTPKFDITVRPVGNADTDGQMGSTVVSTGTWYHLVVTTDGSTLKMYVDGSLQTLTSWSGSVVHNGQWIGDVLFPQDRSCEICSAANYFNGYVDEVTQWDLEFSAAQVTELYNGGSPADPTTHSAYALDSANLLTYFPMGDGDTYPNLTDQIAGSSFVMTNMEPGDIQGDTA